MVQTGPAMRAHTHTQTHACGGAAGALPRAPAPSTAAAVAPPGWARRAGHPRLPLHHTPAAFPQPSLPVGAALPAAACAALSAHLAGVHTAPALAATLQGDHAAALAGVLGGGPAAARAAAGDRLPPGAAPAADVDIAAAHVAGHGWLSRWVAPAEAVSAQGQLPGPAALGKAAEIAKGHREAAGRQVVGAGGASLGHPLPVGSGKWPPAAYPWPGHSQLCLFCILQAGTVQVQPGFL